MADKPRPLAAASDALQVAGAGLSLAERLAALFTRDPERRVAGRIARLRGRTARLRAKAEDARTPRRAAILRARAAGAEAEADALTGALAACAE